MRVRTKYAIVIVAVTLVLSASVYVALEVYKDDAVDDTHASVNETSDLVAEQIDASVREQRDYVGLVASRPQAREFDRSEQFLDAFLDNSRFYAAQLVVANGTVVDFRGAITDQQRQAVIGSDRSNETYVSRPLRGESFVGDVEYVNQTDSYVLVIAAPIFDGTTVEGVLVGAMYLDDQTVFDVLPPLETSSQTVRVVDGERELHAADRTFESAIRSSATVESTNWRVTVERDRTALDRRLGRLAVFQFLQIGLVVLLMVGLGYWQYAVSLRQTERLLDGFDELGAGNYEYSVSLRGGSEWERMSDGFNELAATLQAREAALRERKQRLQVMYRVLRHNLRNEMSVVLTYADLIADLTTDDQVADAAETIADAGRDLTNLSDRARQIENAIEADVDRCPIDVAGVVTETVADCDERYPDVEIAVSAPDEAWAVALPSLRIAVENVCENACEHNDSAAPRVEVTVTDDRSGALPDTSAQSTDGHGGPVATTDADTAVRIRVADNGPGIPDQERAAIRSGRETALEHGSGLGLWLTYWIVDSSGGRIEFADNDPRGSVVEIALRGTAPSDGREASENRSPADSPGSVD